ncbi:MAG: sigma-70 family RNA polymerase sigma factor [Acidimicrobiia bacterium]|nr:sigma-70 family RNA polymerase sigma factor [Acidimicrobiia bacterium]
MPTWEEVARDHGRFLYTVGYRLTGNHDDTQDLVQEVLLRVQRGLVSYQPGNLQGWLSRITTNVFLDQVRSRKRRPVEPLPDEPDRVLEGGAAADEALDAAQLPAHIQEAVVALPIDYRAVVVLSDVVGLSYGEISDSLDIPVGTVRSRLHRGRLQLRDRLEGHL